MVQMLQLHSLMALLVQLLFIVLAVLDILCSAELLHTHNLLRTILLLLPFHLRWSTHLLLL